MFQSSQSTITMGLTHKNRANSQTGSHPLVNEVVHITSEKTQLHEKSSERTCGTGRATPSEILPSPTAGSTMYEQLGNFLFMGKG